MPSVASLARIVRQAGVAPLEPEQEAPLGVAPVRHGVPKRLLSDNGIALNPSRRGYLGQLVEHVSALDVEAITGKPYKPTTQGKNERFHPTLFRYLDTQPLADPLAELQTQVDAFDHLITRFICRRAGLGC